MAELISQAQHVFRWLWNHHYKVPRLAYWIVVLAGAVPAWLLRPPQLGSLAAWSHPRYYAVAFVIFLGVQGVIRWAIDTHYAAGGLVVPRFAELAGAGGLGRDIQRLLLSSLYEALPSDHSKRVHGLPLTLGRQDRDLSSRLHRRLRASFVVHGDVSADAHGEWSVVARIAEAVSLPVIHTDYNTRDVTPAFTVRDTLFHRLSPSRSVIDIEYPLEFATELQAIVQGIAGRAAHAWQNPTVAIWLLAEAISVAPDSPVTPIDRLYADYALAVAELGGVDEAIAALATRVDRDGCHADALRAYAALLLNQALLYEDDAAPPFSSAAVAALGPAHLRRLAVHHLSRAAEDRQDPLRDVTLYNLAMHAQSPLRENVLDELWHTSGRYRRTWYVKRELGALAWAAAEEASLRGNQREEHRQRSRAAALYSAAIRSRPRFRLVYARASNDVRLFHRFHVPPILYANAADAHSLSNHRFKARWYRWHANKRQKILIRNGNRYASRAEWKAAYAYYDWSIVGWRSDSELFAEVMRATAIRELGDPERAGGLWTSLLEEDRVRAMRARDYAAQRFGKVLRGGPVGTTATRGDESR